MSSRRVTDAEGRVWECRSDAEEVLGQDAKVVCTTAEHEPVHLTVSWSWARIGEKGFARMILTAAGATP